MKIPWVSCTGIGRKNETKIIFVVLLQINWDIPNLVSNAQAVYNYKQLLYTVIARFETPQTICKSTRTIYFRLILSAYPCISTRSSPSRLFQLDLVLSLDLKVG